MRKITATVASKLQVTPTPRVTVLELGGSLKFGKTPGGGVLAGPFKRASSSAWEEAVNIFVYVYLELEVQQR